MALIHKPDVAKLNVQALALLKGFMDAGQRGLTTDQLLGFQYSQEDRDGVLRSKRMGDWRRRKTDLKELGYIFKTEKVPGTDCFRHTLTGWSNDNQLSLIPEADGAAA